MADKLFEMLSHVDSENRDKRIPWVFWHRYHKRGRSQAVVERTLQGAQAVSCRCCVKAGVRYFRLSRPEAFGASATRAGQRTHRRHSTHPGAREPGHHRALSALHLADSERMAIDVLDGNFSGKSHTKSHTEKKGLQT